MGTKFAAIKSEDSLPEATGKWKAYHFFYHASLDRLLRKLVSPLIQRALVEACIDRFFFIRYHLGGPHVRLRWRVLGESGCVRAEALLRKMAADFFRSYPSRESLPEEEILRNNRTILLAEESSLAEETLVMADNTWSAFPADFEVERYGGSEHLNGSLDLFAVSSAYVLKLLRKNEQANPNWPRMALLDVYLELAWGLAGNHEELLGLVDYALSFMGASFNPCADEADRLFTRKAPQLLAWAEQRLSELAGQTPGLAAPPLPLLAEAACRLRAELKGFSPHRLPDLCASHLHMTANRMGIMNPEEVYVSRILFRTMEALRTEKPALWTTIESATVQRKNNGTLRSSGEIARSAVTDFLKGEAAHG
jgi:hypothetical protein